MSFASWCAKIQRASEKIRNKNIILDLVHAHEWMDIYKNQLGLLFLTI